MSQPATDGLLAEPLLPLEERVERLEAAVAALQDSQALEERVSERVAQQLNGRVPAATEQPAPPSVAPPMPAAAQTTLASLALAAVTSPKFRDVPWLIIDLYREAVAIYHMFVDLHYRVAWSTRLLTLILLPAILFSYWWNPLAWVYFVGPVLDKLVDLALAFVMFKALSREARRYMETRHIL